MNNSTSPPGGTVESGSTPKQAHWRQVVASFSASGQSARAYCKARGVSEQSFYGWRRRLTELDRQAASRSPAALTAPAFVPVVVQPRAAVEEFIRVELRGGRVMRLPLSMPAARLAEVVHALEGLA